MDDKKVFLGGTCGESTWRKTLIPRLTIDYFDPVVENWTPECQKNELVERENCDYCLYVITPAMKGVYSIAEVVDDSNKRPDKTIFAFVEENENKFTYEQLMSLNAVGKMVERNGGKCAIGFKEIANILNGDNK